MAEIHPSPETENKERDNIDTLSTGNMEKLLESDDPDTYEVAGGKYSLHGVVYQKKLLMLFALRSINKHKNFKLATEMKMADKLDDVILIYPKIDGTGNLYRFVQAKHRSGEVNDMRKISAADLLKQTDGDFSIPTYFRSYLNILGNHEFSSKGGEIHDIIICSNAGLWLGNSCGDFALTEDIFEGVDEEDFIFGNSLKKLKKEFRGREKVEYLLLNCFSKFPEHFANAVVSSKPYCHNELEFQNKATYFDNLYEIAFIEEVVDLSSKKFRCAFVEGSNFSGTAYHFRQCLVFEWSRLNEPEKFQDWLRNVVLHITGMTGDHGLKVKSVAKKISEAVRKNGKEKIIYINDKESVIYKNMEKLTLLGVFEAREDEFRFSRRFLDSERLSEIVLAIRTELLKDLSYFNINKTDIENVRIQLDQKLIQSRYQTLGNFFPEKYVNHFLSKLVFAFGQPNELELETILKNELRPYTVGNEPETLYNKLFTFVDKWMSSRKGRYLGEEEIRKIFQDIKFTFDLRSTVSNFTGRIKELDELHKALFSTDCKSAIISQTASISGLGGIGKSEVARMYAKLHRNEFNSIVWIDSEGQDKLISSFRRLAFDRLNISKKNSNGEEKNMVSIIEEVYHVLSGRKNLFVFDNAEQYSSREERNSGVQNYMMPSSQNYYIVTSRNQNWGNIKVLSLDKLTEDEAIDFFKLSFGESEQVHFEVYKKLADALGNFPLAMQHAVAYIKETSKEFKIFSKHYSVSDYLDDFEKKSKELLEHEFPYDSDDQYTRTTYTTWKLAIQAISPKEHGSLSLKILNIISYLQPDHIDSSLLTKIFHTEDDREISKALLVLQQYSLISIQDNIIRVHRLLQLVIRINLKDSCLEKDTLISILQSWECLHLGHLISVWNSVHHYEELVRENTCLPQQIIVNLCTFYQPKIALSFGRNLELTYRNIFGYYHFNTTHLRRLIAEVFAYNGYWKERFDLLQSTYEEQREFLGDFHPSTLITQRQLASASSLVSDSIDNANIFQDLYDKSNIVLGENYVFALGVKKDCALSLYNKFKFNEAFELFQEIVEQYNKIHSSDLGEIVAFAELMMAKIKLLVNEDFAQNYELFERKAVEILGRIDKMFLRVYLNATDNTESTLLNGFIINAYRRFFEIYKKQYGEVDYDLIRWRFRYASCLLDSSYIDESLLELEDIYDKQKCFLSQNHSDVLFTRHLIAKAICKKSNHQEALRIHKEVFASADKKYDMIFLQSEIEISQEYCHLGQYDRALEIMEGMMSSRIFNQFSRKWSTIKILSHYGTVLRLAGQFEKADEKYSELMRILNDSLGSRSIFTIKVGVLYSVSLNESGNRKKSLEVLKEILYQINEMDIKADMLEELSLNDLVADALCKLKINDKEKSFRLRSLQTLEKLFGKQQPKTLLTMSKLAMVECKLGNDQNSRKLLQDIELNLPKLQNPEDFLEVELMVVEILSRLKDFKECLKRMEHIQNIQCKKKILEESTLTHTMLNVSITMCENGKFDDSLKLLKDIRTRRCLFLGSNHRATLMVTRDIVKVLLEKQDFKNALKECKKLLYIQRNTYGEEDIDTIRTKCVHAHILARKKQYSEALEILNQCHRLMSDKLGEDDEEVLNVEHWIGCILYENGESEHGIKYLFKVYKKQETLLGKNNKGTIITKSFLEHVFRREAKKRKK